MPLKINFENIGTIKLNGENISKIKFNGETYFDGNSASENSITMSYSNRVINLHGANGSYDLHYADTNGILADNKKIGSVTVSNGVGQYTHLNNFNVAPLNATRIVACKNGVIKGGMTLPSDLVANLGTKLYSVGLLSDVHIDNNGADEAFSNTDFTRALTYFNTRASAVCISGDLVCDAGYSEMTKFKTLRDSTASIPVYASRGNHDCRYSLTEWQSLGYDLYYEQTINNEHYLFVGMNSEDYSDNCFTTATLTWLENKLEQYKNSRTYLFFHVFMPNTCGNINNLYPWSSLNISSTKISKFIELMEHYKNVIYFSGHSHLEFELQRYGANANIFDNGTTCKRVHIPSCAKPRLNPTGTQGNTSDNYIGSLGYLMDIYENAVLLRGIDFENNKFVPIANYLLDTTLVEYEETPVEKTGSITVYPSSYDNTNYSYASVNNSYPLNNAVGKASTNTSYAQWNIKIGSNAESYVYYNFDLSSIPANATITNVTCSAKAYISNTTSSRVNTRTMQMYAGNTAKGSASTVSTSATEQTLSVGTWTRQELQNARIRIYSKRGTSSTSTQYYNRFYGATLTVNYTYFE